MTSSGASVTTKDATPFLNINSKINLPNSGYSERGLLGVAFHPNYASNGYIYVNYSLKVNGGTFLPYLSLSYNILASTVASY